MTIILLKVCQIQSIQWVKDWNNLIIASHHLRKYNKPPKNKNITVKELINSFIKLEDPHPSHYHRNNCPNKLYIDNSNTIQLYLEFAKENKFSPNFTNSKIK
jgi:hypothetical protein